MEASPTGAPAIPPRRVVPNIISPPVPSRWETCNLHPNCRYFAICKTCVRFLCKDCSAQFPLEHAQCDVSFLDTNLFSTCEELTYQVAKKLKTSKRHISHFHRTLSKKRDRMIKKRNETVAEIERYFGVLKDKLLRKLKNDETALLNHLNEKVAEQDEVITKSIDECSDVLEVIEEKRTLVSNLERLCSVQRGNSSVNFLKSVVKTSDEISECTKPRPSIQAARDAFLVIRFYVDSEAEQSTLKNKVASVEVLNSQDSDLTSVTLETEGINEASQNVNVETEHDLRFIDDDHSEELRVALPPTELTGLSRSHHRSPNRSPSEGIGPRSRPASVPPVCEILSPEVLWNSSENSNIDANDAAESSERDDDDGNTEMSTDAETGAKQAPSDVADSRNLQTPTGSRASSSPVTFIPETSENTDTTQVRNPESDVTRGDAEAEPEDDPPPPYPGFPRLQPRPNELPPPYPGPPPPPYTQNPEPPRSEHFRRGRLMGQSDQQEERSLVSISPSLQSEAPSTRGLKITKVFSVTEIHDRRSAGIFALAVVRSNCFVVVDRWNKKLKYFDPSGDSFGGLIFREEPWDVTLVTADLVAVTVPKLNTLYKIKVTEQSVITTSTVSTLRKYACVSFHKDSDKFVCGQVPQFGEPVIDVIDINGGPILQTFRQDSVSRDRCMFSYPRYVKVTDDGIIIVCDWNLKCLLLFKLDGSFVGRYKGTVDFPLNEPTGMAYDSEKQEIYVIDSKYSSLSAAIHTVSLSCECKDIIRWDNELRVAPAISPCRPGFAVGSKSGLVSLFTARQPRTSV